MSDQSKSVEKVRHLFQNIFAGKDLDHKETSNTKSIFVSIDIAHGNKKGISAIGVSVLDTRCFIRPIQQLTNYNHSLLWTRTYIFNYGPQEIRRAQKRALFNGSAQKVAASDRIDLLRHVFSYPQVADVETCCKSQKFRPFQPSGIFQSPSSAGDRRPIIAVGHAIHQDLCSLSKAGFDIAQVAPILAVIDTQKIA